MISYFLGECDFIPANNGVEFGSDLPDSGLPPVNPATGTRTRGNSPRYTSPKAAKAP